MTLILYFGAENETPPNSHQLLHYQTRTLWHAWYQSQI